MDVFQIKTIKTNNDSRLRRILDFLLIEAGIRELPAVLGLALGNGGALEMPRAFSSLCQSNRLHRTSYHLQILCSMERRASRKLGAGTLLFDSVTCSHFHDEGHIS